MRLTLKRDHRGETRPGGSVSAHLASLVVSPICAFALLSGCGSSSVDTSEASRGTKTGGGGARAEPLRVITAPTPRFRVPRYDTSGTFVQVRDTALDLGAVNAALRQAILEDQSKYAPTARKHANEAPRRYRGVYKTSVDRRLLSASTVVVSALLPAVKLYPGGNQGRGWVAATVRVPSGKAVTITALFAEPAKGLRVLARTWKARVRRTAMARCLRIVPSDYRPTARNYRHFALTTRGLAVGFWQPPACDRLVATVPYAALRPYLSALGTRLVSGVRAAR
jgi:hypothetical protein